MITKKSCLLCIGLILCLLISACSIPGRLMQIIGEAALPAVSESAAGEMLKESESLQPDTALSEKTKSMTDRKKLVDKKAEADEEQTKADEQAENDAQIEAILNQMTIEEKVAQLFILTPEALYTGGDSITVHDDAFAASFDAFPIGGFILSSGNLTGTDQTKTLISQIQTQSMARIGLPAFMCVDEEGGTVARVSGSGAFNVPVTEDMAVIGARGSADEAMQVGIRIGTYLADLGFNIDFAPVADVLTNPDNTVVYDRSFGSDPVLVTKMAAGVSDGLRACGVLSTYKHFPGHGATEADTHEGYAYTMKTWDELLTSELVPFVSGIEDEVPLIMVGHISLPAVTGDNTPASLSEVIITEHLINELGYKGLIVTDALNMGAITEQYTSAEAALKALLAGNDLLLMPADFSGAYQGLLDAVDDGRLSEERIDYSLRKIIAVKLSLIKD